MIFLVHMKIMWLSFFNSSVLKFIGDPCLEYLCYWLQSDAFLILSFLCVGWHSVTMKTSCLLLYPCGYRFCFILICYNPLPSLREGGVRLKQVGQCFWKHSSTTVYPRLTLYLPMPHFGDQLYSDEPCFLIV